MACKTEPTFDVQADSLTAFAREHHRISQEAVRIYEADVRAAIQADEQDVASIEQLLDGMLDFCFDDGMLRLYKDLCRHYYRFNPAAVAYYVQAYREMWDEEFL